MEYASGILSRGAECRRPDFAPSHRYTPHVTACCNNKAGRIRRDTATGTRYRPHRVKLALVDGVHESRMVWENLASETLLGRWRHDWVLLVSLTR